MIFVDSIVSFFAPLTIIPLLLELILLFKIDILTKLLQSNFIPALLFSLLVLIVILSIATLFPFAIERPSAPTEILQSFNL